MKRYKKLLHNIFQNSIYIPIKTKLVVLLDAIDPKNHVAKFKLNFARISLLMYNIKESVKNSSSILL